MEGKGSKQREGKCLQGAKGAPASAGEVLLLDLSHGYMVTSCDDSSTSTLMVCAVFC